MPFFTITTSFSLNETEKGIVSSTITKSTVDELNVAPDKIQILIQSDSKENFSRAGISLSNDNFSIDSRKIDFKTNESYFSGQSNSEEMIIIELDIWQNFSVEEKAFLCKRITSFLKKKFEVNGDNILILIRDMEPTNWIQNGISGVNKDFLDQSRKIK